MLGFNGYRIALPYKMMLTTHETKNNLDELGIEPKTSPMLRERATNCATRPNLTVEKMWSFK